MALLLLLLLLLLLVVLTLRTEGGCVNNPTHCLFQASFFGVGGNSPPPKKNRLQSPLKRLPKCVQSAGGKLTRSHRPPSRSGEKGEGATAKRREEKAGGLLQRGQEGGGTEGTESEGRKLPHLKSG